MAVSSRLKEYRMARTPAEKTDGFQQNLPNHGLAGTPLSFTEPIVPSAFTTTRPSNNPSCRIGTTAI